MLVDLDDDKLDSLNLGVPLTKEKKVISRNLKLIFFLIVLNAILIGVVTYGINNLFDSDKDALKVLKQDKDFKKPNIKVDLEFELVKLKNNMIGLIIRDPYSLSNHAQYQVENGYLTDTIGGIAHLTEHMIFAGSEKYSKFYPYDRTLGGTSFFYTNAFTDDTIQAYFVSSYNNFKNNQAIDIMLDALRHPLYDEEIIKKEIQPINSEFYEGYREQSFLMENIVRQLSSTKTSFNGFGCGNTETLNPNDNKKISKILKQYHMIVNRPEKIFFAFYSNLTMKESEKLIRKKFNYKMYKFPKKELDSDYKKKFENNIKNLKNIEIFDDKLYKHGVYYNSNIKLNILDIFFHIGNVDYKDFQFNIIEYYDYLFFSKTLLNILKEKDFITINNRIEVRTHALLENNNVMVIQFYLSQNGIKNIEEVLTIIYKYIDIMKNEGYKKVYFENYIKYKQNLNIISFKKFYIVGNLPDNIITMTENYRLYGDEQIFLAGTPSINNYNETKLKNLLNNIKYEKSFFLLNINETISTKLSTFLESTTRKTLNYYFADILIGTIPNKFEEKINNNIIYENLTIREIDPYFSEKIEKVTPCYEISHKKCEELNEFDFLNDFKYNATTLKEEDKNYVTKYQIDKSSESNLINAYIKFTIQENELLNDNVLNNILYYYFISKFLFINEVDSVYIEELSNKTISFEIQGFPDNIEKLFNIFLDYFKEEPQEYIFKYILNSFKNGNNGMEMPLFDYTLSTSDAFLNGGENIFDSYSDEFYEKVYNTTFDQFKKMYQEITTTITSIKLKVAGNIEEKLVQNLHNIVKEKIKIIPQNFKIFKLDTEIKNESSFVINYYTKSNLKSVIDNSIVIRYKFDQKYRYYFNVLMGCLNNIAMIYLRFNYSHSYSPRILMYINEKNEFSLVLYEQGRYKEVTEMEEDINGLILGMLNGSIQCENYNNIVESYKIEEVRKFEKSYDNSLFQFFQERDEEDQEEVEKKQEEQKEEENQEEEEEQKEEEVNYPNTFKDFMEKLSPVFTNPQRITVLVARSDLSDEDFKNMVESKKSKINEKYNLNSTITIEHTDDIYYMKNRTYGKLKFI